jgi:HK97 family phage portal protein
MGLFGRLAERLDKTTQSLQTKVALAMLPGVWTPTKIPYTPSHFSAPVDGGAWGNNQASLEMIRQSEELAIALTRIAESIAESEFDICDETGKPIDNGKRNHPAYQLLLKPNPLCNWSDFLQTLVFHKAAGNRYLLIDESMANTPMRLWALRPDRTRPVRSDNWKEPIQGYEHYAEDGRRYVFPVDLVVHHKAPNPFTQYMGMAPTQLMDMTMNMDAAMVEYNWRWFVSGGNPETVLVSDKPMTDSRKREVYDQFRTRYTGTQNAHRMLILDDGLKKDANASPRTPKETDFPASTKINSRKVGGLFGVPPLLMGHVEDANRANSISQMQLFARTAVSPEMRNMNEMMTYVIRRFDPKLQFIFRKFIVVDDELAQQQMTAAADKGALSPNEIRTDYLAKDPVKDPAMDKHYISNTNVAVEDMAAQQEADAAAAKKVAEAPAGPGAKVEDKNKEGDKIPRVGVKQAAGRPFPRGTEAQRRVMRFLQRGRKAPAKKFSVVYAKWIRNVGNQVAEQLEAQPAAQSYGDVVLQAVRTKIRMAAGGDEQSLGDVIMPMYKAELVSQYDALSVLFKIEGPDFNASSGAYVNATAQLATRVTQVEDGVRKSLDAIIRDGLEKGLSPYEIANGTADGSFQGIRGAFSDMAQERAMLISRTETAALQDQSSLFAYKNMGVTKCDVIGCEDFVIMPGETYGCNSQGIPIDQAAIDFHPNHNGAIVPSADDLTESQKMCLLSLQEAA